MNATHLKHLLRAIALAGLLAVVGSVQGHWDNIGQAFALTGDGLALWTGVGTLVWSYIYDIVVKQEEAADAAVAGDNK